MTWFDVAIALLLVISVASGVRGGFSRSGFGLLAVVAAFLGAAWIFPSSLKSFVISFVLLICASGAVAFLLSLWFKRAGPEWLDRLLGGVFGLANVLTFSVLAVLAVMAFAPKLERKFVANSNLAPYAIETACSVAELVPDEMQFRVERSYEELADALPRKFRKKIPRSLPPLSDFR